MVLTDNNPERLIGAALCRRKIIATATTLRQINSYEDRAWRDLTHSVAAKYANEASAIHALTPYRIAIAFEQQILLDSTTGPLHFEAATNATPGALWLTLPQHRLLFAGDGVAVDFPPPVTTITDSKAWIETLGQLMQRKHVHYIVPGTGKAPILRGDIEQQREFLRVLHRTAHTLAQHHGDIGFSSVAQDLGQAFFNQKGQKAVKHIKKDLAYLVEEIQAALARLEETEPRITDLIT